MTHWELSKLPICFWDFLGCRTSPFIEWERRFFSNYTALRAGHPRDRRDAESDRDSDLKLITSAWFVWHLFYESELALISECMQQSGKSNLTTLAFKRGVLTAVTFGLPAVENNGSGAKN